MCGCQKDKPVVTPAQVQRGQIPVRATPAPLPPRIPVGTPTR
jgi:hypothetical protein